eukprot:3735423-Pyramimonas_sp.AAC.1
MEQPDTTALAVWATGAAATAAVAEVRGWLAADLPGEGGKRRVAAACFLRDIRALQAARPCFPLGPAGGPVSRVLGQGDLGTWRAFDEALAATLQDWRARLEAEVHGALVGRVHGPWEGALPARDCKAAPGTARTAPQVLAAVNVGGSFGARGGAGTQEASIVAVLEQLKEAKVAVAAIAEPRLGPGS